MGFFAFIKESLLDGRRGLFRIPADQWDLPAAARKRIDEKNASDNVKRIVPFCVCITLIELINQAAILLTNADPVYRAAYLTSGAGMLLLSSAAVILSYRLLTARPVRAGRCRALYRGFWLLFSLGMLVFINLEIHARGTTNNYFYLLILTATFPLLSWGEALCLFGLDVAVMLPIALGRGGSAQQQLQYLLIAIFALVLSRILYKSCRMNDVMMERLAILAQTDPLTGLLNRRGIQERLGELLGHGGKAVDIAFLMIDIDLFKNYNDRFGHEQGDQCLKKVAGAVARCVPQGAGIAARFGGEEFLVALIGCDAPAALHAAQCVRGEIQQLHIPAGTDAVSPDVTVSVGVAAAKTPPDFIALYERADRALYQAKNDGRNCVRMDSETCN